MDHPWIIKPLKDEVFEGFQFDKKFKNFKFFSEIKPSQLKNQKVYLILEPQHFFMEIMDIPGKILDFIRIQAENRVKESGIFLSTPKTIYKILESFELSTKTFVFGMEEKIINRYLEILRKAQIRTEIVTHKLLSTFCWFKKEFTDKDILLPILIVILEKSGIWYLVVSEKSPLYGKFSAIDEFLGISSQALLEDISILKDYLYRFMREELKGIIFLGKERKKIMKEEFSEAIKLPLIEVESFLLPEICEYPEIFGAIELDPEFNFLPYTEKIFLNQIKWIEKSTPFLLGLTFLNILLAGIFYKSNLELENKIKEELLSIRESINSISYKLPEKSLEKINTYINLEKERITNFNLNEFLIWLSQIWEKNFVLKNLKIENSSNNTYKISIEIEIKGDFLFSQKKTDELIENFEKYFKIENSKFNFIEKENKADLSLNLSLIR